MSFFSRLTDIVTCNLSDILEHEADPRTAIRRIVAEMEEGRSGAMRSVAAAEGSAERLRREVDEHHVQVAVWTTKAKDALAGGDEGAARAALVRRSEIEDVIAGLELQHKAALSTCDHLSTTLRALEARLAEARRRMQRLEAGLSLHAPEPSAAMEQTATEALPLDAARARKVDAELEALKRALGRE